jgi:hypothetical protein
VLIPNNSSLKYSIEQIINDHSYPFIQFYEMTIELLTLNINSRGGY